MFSLVSGRNPGTSCYWLREFPLPQVDEYLNKLYYTETFKEMSLLYVNPNSSIPNKNLFGISYLTKRPTGYFTRGKTSITILQNSSAGV